MEQFDIIFADLDHLMIDRVTPIFEIKKMVFLIPNISNGQFCKSTNIRSQGRPIIALFCGQKQIWLLQKMLGHTPLRYLTVDFNFRNFGHKLDVVGCFCTFYVQG